MSFLLGVLSGQTKKFVFFQKGNKDKLTPIFTFCIYHCNVFINFFMFILFFYDEIMVPNNINIIFYLIIMYSQLCYNTYFENMNLFQCDLHIRKQFEFKCKFLICLCMISSARNTRSTQATGPSWTEPHGNTRNPHIPQKFTRYFRSIPLFWATPFRAITFPPIPDNYPFTTLQ